MPANILNLPAYKVLGVETNDHDYHITAEAVEPSKACPHCRSDNLVGFGRQEQMSARKILFLDFDGVIHGYGQPRFHHRPILEAVLRSHPLVEVVFSTSWRENYDLDTLRNNFSADMQPRFIGVTPVLDVNREPPYVDFVRHKEILLWLENHEMQHHRWIALDDDHREFPPDCQELIVCQPHLGLGEGVVVEELKKRLR